MIRKLQRKIKELYRSTSIQFTLSVSFTLVAIICLLIMGVLFYGQFANSIRQTVIKENEQLVNQVALNVTNYTRTMREISSAMYYNVIKNTDLSEKTLNQEMALLYEVNKDALESIACFTETGELLAAAPNAGLKPDVSILDQEWFVKANEILENPYFSLPHVQNVFENSRNQYRWVVSLARVVELNNRGVTSRGVLLVEMNFNRIQQIFTQIIGENAGYLYLTDSSGNLIYHPQQRLIQSGFFEENNQAIPQYSDGHHEETFLGADRQVIVKSVGYTGWKVVSVISNSEFAMSFQEIRILVLLILVLGIFLLIIVNSFVSSRIANPIQKLDQSVKDLEKGNLPVDIYTGGPVEIEHLGRTIRSVVEQLRELMDEIVLEQEAKQKNEFDALQAQINPHFLYNTLDSIVWMIETGENEKAISMVTALARFFRISLSKGRNIIPIHTELEHAKYYLHIQKMRYGDDFEIITEVDESLLSYGTIKLVLQPLLENAIYHAVEVLGDEGIIVLRVYEKAGDIYLEVEDNGLGMSREMVDGLLDGPIESTRKKGSGMGLKNVNQRVQLYYGIDYGLEIESELDEGTLVRIHLPKDDNY